MDTVAVAKLALSAATYAIDRPYDYQVPRELADTLRPGMRVVVPFLARATAAQRGSCWHSRTDGLRTPNARRS